MVKDWSRAKFCITETVNRLATTPKPKPKPKTTCKHCAWTIYNYNKQLQKMYLPAAPKVRSTCALSVATIWSCRPKHDGWKNNSQWLIENNVITLSKSSEFKAYFLWI